MAARGARPPKAKLDDTGAYKWGVLQADDARRLFQECGSKLPIPDDFYCERMARGLNMLDAGSLLTSVDGEHNDHQRACAAVRDLLRLLPAEISRDRTLALSPLTRTDRGLFWNQPLSPGGLADLRDLQINKKRAEIDRTLSGLLEALKAALPYLEDPYGLEGARKEWTIAARAVAHWAELSWTSAIRDQPDERGRDRSRGVQAAVERLVLKALGGCLKPEDLPESIREDDPKAACDAIRAALRKA